MSHHRIECRPMPDRSPKRRPDVRVALKAETLDLIREQAARHGIEWRAYFQALVERTLAWYECVDRIDTDGKK